MTKEQKLEYLSRAIRKAYPNRVLVFHDGSPDADIMIIGEAPGADEEKQGRPFIGRAGKLMNKNLEMLGWKRSDFYISNIVKYRPQDAKGKTLTPSEREIELFRPSLEKEISVVNPKAIVIFGRIAMTGLGIIGTMSMNHGKIFDLDNRKVLIVYHPAAILRNPNLEKDFLADLEKIKILI